MRTKLPVTQREHDFPADATLMSTTDASSHITYANAAFIAVSGYASDEVLGQARNVVRHADMPPETFADMWATLKAGESWTALVKNRRKNGGHYGVRANTTPVARNGQAVGYMSVRTRPGRDEVAAAEKLCAEFNAGQAGNRAFHKGLLVRPRLMRKSHGQWSAWRPRPARSLRPHAQQPAPEPGRRDRHDAARHQPARPDVPVGR